MNGQIKPFAYQREGVLLIENFQGRAFLADEMGLGKTMQVLWFLKREKIHTLPAIIVCPAAVKFTWEYHARIHAHLNSMMCEGRTPPGQLIEIPPLIIINYDLIHYWERWLEKIKYTTIVFDESTRLSNPKTKRTKTAVRLARRAKNVIGMSGTGLNNRPIELWPTLNAIRPDLFPNRHAFGQYFCRGKMSPWGWEYKGATNITELHQILKQNMMIRRTKKEVLNDLPPKTRRIIPCEMEDKKDYYHAKNNFTSWLQKHQPGRVLTASKAEQISKVGYLLRLVAKNKLASVIDWTNQFLEETDEKIILFGIHKQTIKTLDEKINGKHVIIDGSTPAKKRKQAEDIFNSQKEVRVLIGNLHAAGIGINLQAASAVGITELSWRPADLSQAEDRAHRLGQKNPITCYYFVVPKTIEETLCSLLQNKQKTISKILDGGEQEDDIDIFDRLVAECMIDIDEAVR